MQVVEMNERVKVRADFSPGGKMVPLLFKRDRQDPFRVRKVNASWEDREAKGRRVYFSVSVAESEDVYQLRYQEHDRTWWIDSLMVDG